VRRIETNGLVSTFAGRPEVWGTGDGTGTNARFNGPVGIVVATNGAVFVTDANNHTIRRITPNAVVTTFAGRGGVDGALDGNGTNALFSTPAGLALDR